ncbi:MAG: crotonase/enoyl-CoA hydratase family protein [Sterolibacterium sp.]|jgi:enoyl-CoA hydratase/carnithine racemase
MTMTPPDHFETLAIALADGIARVQLNRPDKANAMNLAMWHEIREAFTWIDTAPAARVAILSGAGKHFTSGIDLSLLSGIHADIADSCDGRQREKLRRMILDLQDTLTSLERCRKPVLAEIRGACMGGGIDLICACDMRYCSADASFSVKEVDVGMTADVGTLQRLPRLIGEGMARELAYTARTFNGGEAQAMGLVNRCYPSAEELHTGVGELARCIADKSPLAVRGSKEMISYTRDHSVADGLNYIATWNAAMLLSDDLGEAMTAARAKRPAKFRD